MRMETDTCNVENLLFIDQSEFFIDQSEFFIDQIIGTWVRKIARYILYTVKYRVQGIVNVKVPTIIGA